MRGHSCRELRRSRVVVAGRRWRRGCESHEALDLFAIEDLFFQQAARQSLKLFAVRAQLLRGLRVTAVKDAADFLINQHRGLLAVVALFEEIAAEKHLPVPLAIGEIAKPFAHPEFT